MLEIQQNSNVTYRLYDYGRLGSDESREHFTSTRALSVQTQRKLHQRYSAYAGTVRVFSQNVTILR